MPFVEERQAISSDPAAWVGINVPIVMPAMFCALGQVQVAGLWHVGHTVVSRFRVLKPPPTRGWKTPVRGHQGGF